MQVARTGLGPVFAAMLAGVLAGALTACHDGEGARLLPSDEALVQDTSSSIARTPPVILSDLRAGDAPPTHAQHNPYADDPQALAAGRDLYMTMNCAGCHGPAGGGGIGPPLADAQWIYGDAPENIVQAILEGRPNGMPAFGAKLPPSEAWKIATYVRDLGKHARAQAAADEKTSPSLNATSGAGGRGRP